MAPLRFGPLQLKIMQVLWSAEELTARELTERLQQQGEAVAHSTVQTLLRQLQAKGAVGHRQEARTFYFRALISEQKTTKRVIRQFVDRLFQGTPGELAAHLVENEKLSKADLARLRRLIREKEKET